MDNLIDDLELRVTPARVIGIARGVREELQDELENDLPCRCEDCRMIP